MEQQDAAVDQRLVEAEMLELERDRVRVRDSNARLRQALAKTLDAFENTCEEFVDFRYALSQMGKDMEARARQAHSEAGDARTSLDEARQRVDALESQNKQLTSQLADSQNSNSSSRSALSETLERQEELLTQQRAEIARLKQTSAEKLKAAGSEYLVVKRTLDQKQHELHNARSEVMAAQKKTSFLQTRLQEADSRNSQLESNCFEAEVARKKIYDAYLAKTAEYDKLETSLRETEAESRDRAALADGYLKELNATRADFALLKKDLLERKNHEAEALHLRHEHARLLGEMDRLKSRILDLQDSNEVVASAWMFVCKICACMKACNYVCQILAKQLNAANQAAAAGGVNAAGSTAGAHPASTSELLELKTKYGELLEVCKDLWSRVPPEN